MAKKKKTTKINNDKLNLYPKPKIEEEYYEEIEFDCPIRGKIKQKVRIKKYKTTLINTGLDQIPLSDNYGIKNDDVQLFEEQSSGEIDIEDIKVNEEK